MNQKIVFCIAFLVIFCCDISISSAAVEKNMGDFDDINKTLTIYDNESKVMTVRLISAVPDIGTFTEIFEVSNFEAYTPDSKADFTARTATVVGSGAVTDTEWFIEQNTSYIVNVTDYGIKEVEEIIFNNKTGKNETVLVNKTVITGYHDETRYKVTWIDYQPYANEMKKDQVLKIKVVYHKVPELGPFRIQTVPVFRGVECPELTWWSGSWDRGRVILINNTVGDSVIDYQLKSVNLSSYNINASSARIINSTSNLEESFWNETVDGNGNLEYVWCNFSSLPGGGWINSTYKVYYQSIPSASSSSDGDATFIDFDGFSTDTSGDYTVNGGSIVVSGGIMDWTGVSGVHVFVAPTVQTAISNYIVEARMRTHDKNNVNYYDGSVTGYQTTVTSSTTGYSAGSGKTAGNDKVMIYDPGVPSTVGTAISFTDNSWFLQKGVFITDNVISYYNRGTSHSYGSNAYASGYYGFHCNDNDLDIDWWFVREYTTNEPEPWTVGDEEEYSAPTPTPTPPSTTSVSPISYDELDLPLILYILMISMLYLLIAFRNGVATIELSLIYLIFAFIFLLFQTVTLSVNYIYLTLFLFLFVTSIAGITKQGVD